MNLAIFLLILSLVGFFILRYLLRLAEPVYEKNYDVYGKEVYINRKRKWYE